MKKDTDQLVQLIKKVKTYTLKELGISTAYTNSLNGQWILSKIAQFNLALPKGTVFKIAELSTLLQRMCILVISGGKTDNVIVCIDISTLAVERILFQKAPRTEVPVKCVSFPSYNTMTVTSAVEQIVVGYRNMVSKIKLGLLDDSFRSHTLLNVIFEYALTGRVITEISSEILD